MVMPKDGLLVLDELHHSVSEWIEPHLVFRKSFGQTFHIRDLQYLPKTREALMSLLSDPVVTNAVMENKMFQELASEYTESLENNNQNDDNEDEDCYGDYEGGGNDARDSISISGSILGERVYKVLKEKLVEVSNYLCSLLNSEHTLEEKSVDKIDAIAMPCIILVSVLVLLIIGKRSRDGPCHTRPL
ncbi:hypothetical protein KP509_06G030100 [Ceratopteris richardii]|nr:hypothetical protein KP509_06G030100 [Ceratopteris richardii]